MPPTTPATPTRSAPTPTVPLNARATRATPATGPSAQSAGGPSTRTTRGPSPARTVLRGCSLLLLRTVSTTASAGMGTKGLMGTRMGARSARRGSSRLSMRPGCARIALRDSRARRKGHRCAIRATRIPIRPVAQVAVAALLRGRANLARVRQSRPDSGLNFHVKVLNATLETTSGQMAPPQKWTPSYNATCISWYSWTRPLLGGVICPDVVFRVVF